MTSRTLIAPATALFALSSAAGLGGGLAARAAAAQPAPSLRSPSPAALAKAGPDSFDVAVHTSKGAMTMRIRRRWAPRGSDRVYHAVQARYYDGNRFFRVIPGFMAQFGFHGDPTVNRTWDAYRMPDDAVKVSNTRGIVTFATRGPGSRTVQLFVNTGNNESLDGMGFAPVGSVLEGMAVVDSLYSGYGEGSPRGPGPDQNKLGSQGNAYLAKSYPKLDFIDSARVVKSWTSAAPPAAPPAARGKRPSR